MENWKKLKKMSDLEYQFRYGKGMELISNSKWKEAEACFKLLLSVAYSDEAYIGLVLSQMQEEKVPFIDDREWQPYNMKKVWDCANFDEIAEQYVIEPYFTRKDLKDLFVIDEVANSFYEWFFFLDMGKSKFIDKWFSLKSVKEAPLFMSKEGLIKLKEIFDKTVETYLLYMNMAKDGVNRNIASRINTAYENTILQYNISRRKPRDIEIVTKFDNTIENKEYKKYEPIAFAKDKKHDGKAKVASFAIMGVYAAIAILLSAFKVPFTAPILTVLAMLVPVLYQCTKKVMLGNSIPVWVKHDKLFSIGTLAVSVIAVIISIIGQEFDAICFAIMGYLPLWLYIFISGKYRTKKCIIPVIFALIITNVCGFFPTMYQSFFGSIIVHLVGLFSLCFADNKRSKGGLLFTSMTVIFLVTAACTYVDKTWIYIVLNIVGLAFFHYPWRSGMIDLGYGGVQTASANYSGGSNSSNDSSSDDSGSACGFDIPAWDEQRRQETEAFSAAQEEQRKKDADANDVIKQYYE